MNIEEICDEQGNRLALLVSQLSSLPAGHTFPTSPEDQMQLGLFHHPSGHEIKRHYHPEFKRSLDFTTEVLVILSGLVRVDLYNSEQELVTSRELADGSVAVLISGGHGFEILKESIIVEVKQGPYAGQNDKILF